MNLLNVKHQGKSSDQLAFTCQLTRIYKNFKERYFRSIQRDDCLEDSESDSHDKSDIKGKVNVLVRLHKAMQEILKTASYSEQI